jgi:hypothetical protein
MANRERGEIGLDVDGTRYTLRPTINAICELEDLAGKPFADIAREAEAGSVRAMRLLIWCYLRDAHADEIKTPVDAGAWIQRFGSIAHLGAVLGDIAQLNTVDADEKKRPASKPEPASIAAGVPATLTRAGSG